MNEATLTDTRRDGQPKGYVLRTPRRVLALRDLDERSLERSASGGAFPVLARPIVADRGIVIGARLCEDGTVRHVCVEDAEGLSSLQGSVYACSKLERSYALVAEALASGRRTFFVGTPCQCAGLVSHLKHKGLVSSLEESENLIVCDLVCHGTPKQAIFSAHQQWLADKVQADDGIHGFKFRSKKRGWGLYYYYYYYRNGRRHEVCEPAEYDPYYRAFLRGLIYRSGCYSCPFSRCERVSDFTIGDYWGIEWAHPDFYDERGVSLLLVNTLKGESYFDARCSGSCIWRESTFEQASRENHNLKAPTPRGEGYEALMSEVNACLDAQNYDKLFDEVLKLQLKPKDRIKRVLPGGLLDILRKLKRH